MIRVVLLLALQASDPLAVMDDPQRPDENILHYAINLAIPDSGDDIKASVGVRYLVRGGRGPLLLDFDSALVVDSITTAAGRVPRAALSAARGAQGWDLMPQHGRWILAVPLWGDPGDTLTATIHYHGRPRDGLYLRRDPGSDRTAFADNWPNRAHYWFPCNDLPSDKATVEFAIDVPATWRAVANGKLAGVDTVSGGRTVWRWQSTRRIPTYTMVVGAARMSVTYLQDSSGVPQSVWTLPGDSAFAVQGPFLRAATILETFTRLLGPYPYAKLAHVESSTRFGGMENSSAIFYAERPYRDRSMTEEVVAHETAHQWFGDAVTERDWHHLWLSEGFASYLAPLFYELVGEPQQFHLLMDRGRRVYMASNVVDRPIIDTAEKDIPRLLNENNYPKGAWVLHMLRQEVGDSAFFAGLRAYYARFRDSTALSSDFAAVMQRVSDQPLEWFFEQWLLQPGYPRLTVSWTSGDGELELDVAQVQPARWGLYRLRLPLRVTFADGRTEDYTVDLPPQARTTVTLPVPARPTRLVADPEGGLLAEATVMAPSR